MQEKPRTYIDERAALTNHSGVSASPARPTLLRPAYEIGVCRLYVELWPIAVIDLGDSDGPMITALLQKVDELVIARREPYIMVTDARRMTSVPSADVRKAIAAWMQKNARGHTSLGAVTILQSALVRGALTAVYWVFQPPNPQGIAADWTEAHAWSMKHLDAAKVLVRPSVRDAHAQPY